MRAALHYYLMQGTVLYLAAILAVGLLWFVPQIYTHREFYADDYYNLYVLKTFGVLMPWSEIDHLNYISMRPIASLSLYADILLYGTKASGYYISNLVLHLASVIAFYFLLLHVQKVVLNIQNSYMAFLFSLILLLHSDVFYSVLWICNRTESMSLLLNLLFVRCMLKYLTSRSVGTFLFMLLLLVASLFVKAHAISLPFLFISTAAFLNHRKNINTERWPTIMAFIGLLLPILIYYAFWQHAGDIPQLTFDILRTKVFSIFALLLLMIHPEFLYQGYQWLFEERAILIFIISFSIFALGWTFRTLSVHSRYSLFFLISVLASLIIPRAAHLVSTRINSFPEAVTLLIVSMIALNMQKKRAYMLAVFLLLLHIASSIYYIGEWRDSFSNERYIRLTEESSLSSPEGSVLLAQGTLFDRYALHFIRTQEFGFDTSLRSTNLIIIRKPFLRTRKEYSVEKIGSELHFTSLDHRVGFSLDSRMINNTGVNIETLEPLRGYGYKKAVVKFKEGESRTFFIDSSYSFVKLR